MREGGLGVRGGTRCCFLVGPVEGYIISHVASKNNEAPEILARHKSAEHIYMHTANRQQNTQIRYSRHRKKP